MAALIILSDGYRMSLKNRSVKLEPIRTCPNQPVTALIRLKSDYRPSLINKSIELELA